MRIYWATHIYLGIGWEHCLGYKTTADIKIYVDKKYVRLGTKHLKEPTCQYCAELATLSHIVVALYNNIISCCCILVCEKCDTQLIRARIPALSTAYFSLRHSLCDDVARYIFAHLVV